MKSPTEQTSCPLHSNPLEIYNSTTRRSIVPSASETIANVSVQAGHQRAGRAVLHLLGQAATEWYQGT